MVRQKGFTGKHKISDRWEKDYYEVISQKSHVPVFMVRSLEKDKKERTLHRNMLYPLSFQVQSGEEQHDDSPGANDLELYQSIDEGKSINVRSFCH